jgi:hypothetical protein
MSFNFTKYYKHISKRASFLDVPNEQSGAPQNLKWVPEDGGNPGHWSLVEAVAGGGGTLYNLTDVEAEAIDGAAAGSILTLGAPTTAELTLSDGQGSIVFRAADAGAAGNNMVIVTRQLDGSDIQVDDLMEGGDPVWAITADWNATVSAEAVVQALNEVWTFDQRFEIIIGEYSGVFNALPESGIPWSGDTDTHQFNLSDGYDARWAPQSINAEIFSNYLKVVDPQSGFKMPADGILVYKLGDDATSSSMSWRSDGTTTTDSEDNSVIFTISAVQKGAAGDNIAIVWEQVQAGGESITLSEDRSQVTIKADFTNTLDPATFKTWIDEFNANAGPDGTVIEAVVSGGGAPFQALTPISASLAGGFDGAACFAPGIFPLPSPAPELALNDLTDVYSEHPSANSYLKYFEGQRSNGSIYQPDFQVRVEANQVGTARDGLRILMVNDDGLADAAINGSFVWNIGEKPTFTLTAKWASGVTAQGFIDALVSADTDSGQNLISVSLLIGNGTDTFVTQPDDVVFSGGAESLWQPSLLSGNLNELLGTHGDSSGVLTWYPGEGGSEGWWAVSSSGGNGGGIIVTGDPSPGDVPEWGDGQWKPKAHGLFCGSEATTLKYDADVEPLKPQGDLAGSAFEGDWAADLSLTQFHVILRNESAGKRYIFIDNFHRASVPAGEQPKVGVELPDLSLEGLSGLEATGRCITVVDAGDFAGAGMASTPHPAGLQEVNCITVRAPNGGLINGEVEVEIWDRAAYKFVCTGIPTNGTGGYEWIIE